MYFVSKRGGGKKPLDLSFVEKKSSIAEANVATKQIFQLENNRPNHTKNQSIGFYLMKKTESKD